MCVGGQQANLLSHYPMHVAHVGATPATVVRHRPLRGDEEVLCPPLLPHFMRGVDRGGSADPILYNAAGRRSKKWWKCVFAHLLEVSILNSYVLWKHAHCARPAEKLTKKA